MGHRVVAWYSDSNNRSYLLDDFDMFSILDSYMNTLVELNLNISITNDNTIHIDELNNNVFLAANIYSDNAGFTSYSKLYKYSIDNGELSLIFNNSFYGFIANSSSYSIHLVNSTDLIECSFIHGNCKSIFNIERVGNILVYLWRMSCFVFSAILGVWRDFGCSVQFSATILFILSSYIGASVNFLSFNLSSLEFGFGLLSSLPFTKLKLTSENQLIFLTGSDSFQSYIAYSLQGDFGLHNQNFSKYLHHPTSNDITQVNLIYDLEFTFSDTYFGNTDGEYGLLNTQITITETNSVVLLYSCLSTGSTERSVNSDKNTYANGVINFHIGSIVNCTANGYFSGSAFINDIAQCVPCRKGHICPNGQLLSCPDGFFCNDTNLAFSQPFVL